MTFLTRADPLKLFLGGSIKIWTLPESLNPATGLSMSGGMRESSHDEGNVLILSNSNVSAGVCESSHGEGSGSISASASMSVGMSEFSHDEGSASESIPATAGASISAAVKNFQSILVFPKRQIGRQLRSFKR